ncbi:MAG: hypothetical protein KBS91_00825, partial [Firmicutes bacterium]|nr:hypothetical protein [Candidatus Caballimonas caccae]
REEQEKNREQNLMIKANPVVYLQNISRFDFNNHFVISTVNSSSGNNLYEIKPKEKFVKSSCFFSFDLVFKNDFGKMVDFITILSANLVCQKDNFTDESYEEKIVKKFSNFNDRKALIKVTGCGNIVVLLQLFLNNIDAEEVKFWLQDETIVWSLRFTYCLSNSCGVEVEFESQIVFNVEPNSIETSFGIKSKPNIKQIVTWQRSAVTVSKENKNELNA